MVFNFLVRVSYVRTAYKEDFSQLVGDARDLISLICTSCLAKHRPRL